MLLFEKFVEDGRGWRESLERGEAPVVILFNFKVSDRESDRSLTTTYPSAIWPAAHDEVSAHPSTTV